MKSFQEKEPVLNTGLHPRRTRLRVAALWLGLAIPALLFLATASVPRIGDRGPAVWSLVIRWPGMDAKGLEEKLALPLEEGLSALEGFKGGRFTCNAGEIQGRLHLADPAAAERLSHFLDVLHARLPAEVPRPSLSANDPDDRPFWLAAIGTVEDALMPSKLRDELLALDGVGSCELSGLGENELLVVPDEERLRDSLLPISSIASALRAPGRAADAGKTGAFGGALPVRISAVHAGETETNSAYPAEQLVLEGSPGLVVGDLGEARWVQREPASRSYLDGQPLVMLSVTAAAGTDKRLLSWDIAGLVARFRQQHPDIRLEVLDDEGAMLEQSWRELLAAAAASLILVFAATLLICRQERGGFGGLSLALLCALCVPLVIFFAVILLLFAGQRLDRTLLTALAISSGFTIDAFLVAMEMLFYVPSDTGGQGRSGASSLRVLERVLVSSAGTTLIALIPLCAASNADLALIGKTLFATILVSLFVARFFLVPLVRSLSFNRKFPMKKTVKRPASSRPYCRFLARAAHSLEAHRPVHAALWGLIIIGSLVCIPVALDRRAGEEGALIPFSISFEPGTGRAARARRIGDFSAGLSSRFDGDVTVWALITGDQARGSVRRDAQEISSKAVLDALRAQTVEGGSVHAGYGSSDEHWWEVRVYSNNSVNARNAARKFALALESDGIVLHFRPGDPQLSLLPVRSAIAVSGLDLASLSGGLRRMLEGVVVGKLVGPAGEHDVRLSSAEREEPFNPGTLAGFDALKAAHLALGGGRSFPVASLFTFSETVGPVSLERENRQALARLSFSTGNASMAAARKIFSRALEDLDLPARTRVVFDPDACTEAADTRRLVALVFVAALFCVLFLGCIDNSLRGPLLCLFSLLPALASAFPVLLWSGIGAGPPALCGAILLSGLGINAAILCLERLEGRAPSSFTLYYLWRERLPLVATTSLTSIFSCLPFALLQGASAAMARELSIVCIAGIIVAALSSLIFLPLLWGFVSSYPREKAPVPETRRPVCGGRNP